MIRTQRGITLLEVMISMAVVMVGMLGLFKVLGASIQGSASAQRFTQAQARMQQVQEAIRLAPAPVLSCLLATPATGWAVCEAQCRAAAGPNPSPQSCVFYTLGASKQAADPSSQQYAVIVDGADPTRTTRVVAAGVSGRVFDVMITIGWSDDGTVGNPPDHRVTARSAVFQMIRSRGFTLMEMMVSLALGGMLLAGAFQLHAAFSRQSTRQQQVADMQQSLRVSRQIMERLLRGAGAGLGGNPVAVNQCAGPPQLYQIVEFSNNNAYFNQRVAFDTTAADADVDPDWVRVISVNPNLSLAGRAVNPNATAIALNGAQYAANDQFVVIGNNPALNLRQNCLLQVTGPPSAAAGSCPTCMVLPHALTCLNPNGDPCLANVNFPTPIRQANTGMAVFRVETTATGWCPNPPCLGASFTNIGAAPNWQLISENIEDLQVALVLRTGVICGSSTNSVDSPALCPPQSVDAVRFTLTARSSSQVSDFQQGRTIPAEDMPVVAGPPDGYLRRSLTTEVDLRNQ